MIIKTILENYWPNGYWPFYTDLILITFLVIVYSRTKNREEGLKSFDFFILMVLLFEVVISNVSMQLFQTNVLVYNVFFLLCISYYFLMISQELINTKAYLVFKYGFVLWILFSILNLLAFQGINDNNTYSWISGMIFILVVATRYLIELVRNKESEPLYFNETFILIIGIFGMYATSFPFIFHMDLITELAFEPAYTFLKLVQLGNIILSLSYLYIALCPILKLHWSKK